MANRRDPWFTSAGPMRSSVGKLTDKPFNRLNTPHMIKRRARKAGLSDELCRHPFRGTGIRLCLENDGDLDTAQYESEMMEMKKAA